MPEVPAEEQLQEPLADEEGDGDVGGSQDDQPLIMMDPEHVRAGLNICSVLNMCCLYLYFVAINGSFPSCPQRSTDKTE